MVTEDPVIDPRESAASERQRLLETFRVESIQRAALAVIARRGIARATMQEIADAAGISKGTLYLYFANREAIIESTLEQAIAQLMAALDEIFDRPAPLAQVLPALLERHFTFFDQHQELFRVYRAAVGEAAAEQHRRRNPHYHRYLERLRDLIERAIGRREIPPLDADRFATFFAEGTRALLRRRLLDDATPPPPATDAALLANVLLHGLLGTRSPT